ncbi:MAG TPA: HD domain-containing protein [Polyangiaceae bacterium]|nr:HD domain-containing protein [Polyangiaceae bacterium]
MIDVSLLRNAVPKDVRELCARLREAGHRSWIVGGCVRDHLLSQIRHGAPQPENDWDVATDARPERVQQLFRKVIPTGLEHGTVTVLINGTGYEVTTLRGETTYSDGRRPDAVYFVDDIVADLARRDFTINAMAYDPLEDNLIDPFSGAADLKANVLRAVGEASERFAEDGLRVLRAARFVATLEVDMAPATAAAIEPSLSSYRKVSPERIRDEWIKAMKAERPSRAFEIMREHGLLSISAPELLESVGCAQNRHHAFDVWGHAMACLDNCPSHPVLRMSGLLHDVGKPRSRAFSDKTRDYTFYDHERIGAEMTDPMLKRLRFSNDDRARIVQLIRHHLICYDASWSDAAVRRWVRRVTPDLLGDLYELNRADVLGEGRDATEDLERLEELKARVGAVQSAGAAFAVKDLAVNGHDLMQIAGRAAGPWLGATLRALLEEVTELPELNQREPLLQRAKDILSTPSGPLDGK